MLEAATGRRKEAWMTAEGSRHDDPRRAYYDAAYAILSEEGYGGLKLIAVCRRLSVTTGGFYHWFASWSDFTVAFLDDWRRRRTTALAELAASVADPLERMELLAATTAGLNRAAEGAIRVWSRVDPVVGEVQRQVDDERFAIVLESTRQVVGDEHARRFALWGYSVLVGFELLAGTGADDELAWSLDQILEAERRFSAGS